MSTIFGELRHLPESIIHLDRDLLYADKAYKQWIRGVLFIMYQLPAALLQVLGVFEPRSVADNAA